MVRIFFSLLVLTLAGGLMGCQHDGCGLTGCQNNNGHAAFAHGICDCDRDENPCAHRAPWAMTTTMTGTMTPATGATGPQDTPMSPGTPLPKTER
jgi:hypothetical protein